MLSNANEEAQEPVERKQYSTAAANRSAEKAHNSDDSTADTMRAEKDTADTMRAEKKEHEASRKHATAHTNAERGSEAARIENDTCCDMARENTRYLERVIDTLKKSVHIDESELAQQINVFRTMHRVICARPLPALQGITRSSEEEIHSSFFNPAIREDSEEQKQLPELEQLFDARIDSDEALLFLFQQLDVEKNGHVKLEEMKRCVYSLKD